MVKDELELGSWVEAALLEGVHYGHESASGFGAGIGLGAETDFAGGDGRAKVARFSGDEDSGFGVTRGTAILQRDTFAGEQAAPETDERGASDDAEENPPR